MQRLRAQRWKEFRRMRDRALPGMKQRILEYQDQLAAADRELFYQARRAAKFKRLMFANIFANMIAIVLGGLLIASMSC